MTKGWLRASHRKLDPEKSLPYRPYHAHDERLWLKPGEIVECDVEVWPTSMVFKKGHKLRVDIQPRDGVGSAPYTHYHADYNAGASNTIYAGRRQGVVSAAADHSAESGMILRNESLLIDVGVFRTQVQLALRTRNKNKSATEITENTEEKPITRHV